MIKYMIDYICYHICHHMTDIVTTSEVQQKIGQISATIDKKSYIVTNRGKAKMVILPYFPEGQGVIEDYLEDFEMWMNRDELKKKYQESVDSGDSDLVI